MTNFFHPDDMAVLREYVDDLYKQAQEKRERARRRSDLGWALFLVMLFIIQIGLAIDLVYFALHDTDIL